MALTISEASAVNVVALHVLGRVRPVTGERPTEHEVTEALALLSDHAHKALMAGLTGADVRKARPTPAQRR